MEKGIRQKRYQKFTKNGKVWSEWFNWSGEEPEWQLKGRLRNEYRTIYPSGGSFLDGEANSKAGANEAATANGNGLQLPLFPEGSLNSQKEGKQLTPSRKRRSPRRRESNSLQERNKRNWMGLYKGLL